MEKESCILPSRTELEAPALRSAMVDLMGFWHKCLKRSSNDEAYGLLEQPFLDQDFLGWSGVHFSASQNLSLQLKYLLFLVSGR